MWIRRRLSFLASTAIVLAWGAQAGAAEPGATLLPAVDGINGKLDGFGGWSDGQFGGSGDFIGGVLGSVTVPLGSRLGFQLDGIAASVRGDFAGGGAAHLFTRDPSRHLLGIYGSAVGFDNRTKSWNAKVGLEAEFYIGRFTLSGVLGYEHMGGDSVQIGFAGGTTFGIQTIEEAKTGGAFFDYIDLNYYVTDDWKVSAGHRHTGERHAAAFGTEMLVPVAGGRSMSAFVEARIGEGDYKTVLAGLKFHFGTGDKPLIQRHRESDPTNYLKDDLFSPPVTRRTNTVGIAPPPPPPPPCNNGNSNCGPCGCGGT